MFFSLFPWLQGRKECFNPNRGESDSNNEGGIQFIDNKTYGCVNSGFQYCTSGVIFRGLPYCYYHCCHAISLLLVVNNSTCVYFCLLSVMNVVMVLENNQNNILPYGSRFLQMPKVEIQGLFNYFEGQVLDN